MDQEVPGRAVSYWTAPTPRRVAIGCRRRGQNANRSRLPTASSPSRTYCPAVAGRNDWSHRATTPFQGRTTR
ncbi:hypothetical protein C2845_PM14G19370 [Panicum miliaceum]|uniref:Uncharacterized protein n=1 Tax=Panicum miliaceum TaxID=4540 RepID=A0A3L6PPM8_PANMI|nr:hypothetical protein C2845_PM14G19370 [Panicum miliaceum]